jgi:hypothetical protein
MLNLTNFNRPLQELTEAIISFDQTIQNAMKKILSTSLWLLLFILIPFVSASAQEKGQKKVHVVIEENGTVVTDTSMIFAGNVSEEEIEATISGITGEKSHPCHVHMQPAKHCDTVMYKCKHTQKGELDSLLEATGQPSALTPADTCRHARTSCMNHTERVGAGQEPRRHIEKEVIRVGEPEDNESVIIEDNGDIIIRKGNVPGKCIKVIVESDGDTAACEKVKEVRILRSGGEEMARPEEHGEKRIEKKIIITEEGTKAEKATIHESPANTEKKSKKDQ